MTAAMGELIPLDTQWSQQSYEQEVGGPAVCLHTCWRTDFSSGPQEKQRIYFIVQHSQTNPSAKISLDKTFVVPCCDSSLSARCRVIMWVASINVPHIFHQESSIVNKIHFYKGVLTKKLRKLQTWEEKMKKIVSFRLLMGQFNINHIATWLVSLSKISWKWE